MSDCPFCKGRGHNPEEGIPAGLLCLSCNGTGDYETMKLLRAYRLGSAHAHAKLIGRLTNRYDYEDRRELTFETIQAAIIDDARLQRYEEMLMPDSIENRALKTKVEQYERERGTVLEYLSSLAAELREQLDSELPRPGGGIA
jgi:hypothetical protein